MSFDERAIQLVTFGHAWPILAAVVAPQFIINTFGLGGPASPTDLIYSHWFGNWTALFAFCFYFGNRSRFFYQTMVLGSFTSIIICAEGAGSVIHYGLTLPHIAFFLLFSLTVRELIFLALLSLNLAL